ncbi:MAG: CDP-glycerol:glycerophosphate glycerophosphotransferase [Nocardioidaceae bacterium]
MDLRRLAAAARRRIPSRAAGSEARVSVVVVAPEPEGLDRLAGLTTSSHPALELCVVTTPGLALPRRIGRVPVVRAASLDAAVDLAGGDYLVVADVRDDVPRDAWSAMAAALEESGSDLVVGDARSPGPRPWADVLFARWRRRADVASCPLALVDLALTNKMFRLSAWRGADIRLGPEPVDGPSPAAMAAYQAAGSFDVLAQVVCRSLPLDIALPVSEQARFRAPVLARRLAVLAEVAETAPAGWRELAATHLLPALYVDAVGGGPAYAEVLRAGLGPLLDGLDADAVPVVARLGAWTARHGTLEDVALLLALLADHPDGLPVRDGLVAAPAGLSVDLPPAWREVRDVDRRARSWVADRVVRDGERCTLWGASFVEYVEDAPLPAVTLTVPGGGQVPLHVERRADPRTNEWASRAWEDRTDAAWEAVVDPSLLDGDSAPGWSVEVLLNGVRFTHQVHAPRPPGPTGVDAAAFEHGVLTLSGTGDGTGDGAALTLAVSGVRGSAAPTTVGTVEGRFSAAVELTSTVFGRRARLPVGRYDLGLAGGQVWSDALLVDPPELVDDRQRVTPDGGPAIRVRPPLRLHERGAFAQQDLRSRVYAAPASSSYDRTVLLETFRGRGVGDNPGAIGRELLARDAGLDLVWVVDDPGVEVPPGTRAVARRSEAWHDVLARAQVHVANAGAPYWFEKKAGQVHLQTWHGTPLKRIGEDRGPGDFSTWRHRRRIAAQAARWDGLVSPSPYCSRILRSAFGYEGPMLETGYPRNDVLVTDTGQLRRSTRERLGVAEDARVVLYAPTWRDYAGVRDSKPLYLDAERLIRQLPGSVVLVRGHYNSTGQAEVFPGHERILDVTRYPDIADLYLAADALVTDYSSVMFDFALTDRPVVLLVPDLQQYRDVERGFYLDIETTAPGPLVATTDAVVAALTGPDGHAAARASFRERFCPWDDGAASARVVDVLLDRL